jgi:hypothetical protein
MSEPPDPKPFAWQRTIGQAVLELERLYRVLSYHRSRGAELRALVDRGLLHNHEANGLVTAMANAGDRVRERTAEIRKVWEIPLPDPELVPEP